MGRPLRFLHLTTFYPPHSFGGDALYVYRLCHALGEEGHQVDVVHCVDAYHLFHPAEPPIRFADHPNVRRHELRSRHGWLSPLLTQQTGRPLLKQAAIAALLRQHDYDVIHYHNISLLGPAVLALDTPRRRSIKLYTTHEHWLICPMHVLWKLNQRPCEKPECLRCTLAGRRPPQLWRYTGLLERSVRHVDQFVAPSRFTARMHAERGFTQPVEHLPLFLDRVDEDWKRPGPRPHQRPYFLFVGRLERIKGLQTIVPLWAQVPEADLLVAGTGTCEAELRAMAGANPRIRFLGAVSQHELGPLYYHAIACIVPSLTYETFCMANLEAFARKTPVIARDLGPLPEVIEESGGGSVYRDDAELLSQVHRLASNPAIRDELGRRGYETYDRCWTREAHLDQYFGLLTRIARDKFGRPPWSPEPALEVASECTVGAAP
jgi:glycosyltransferase involved in cell wall biosynthesis